MNILIDTSVNKFINKLETSTFAKVLKTPELLEESGIKLGMSHSKKIEKELFELRIRSIQNIRIFYTLKNNEAILLHGFVKKTQKIPQKELETVRKKLRIL